MTSDVKKLSFGQKSRPRPNQTTAIKTGKATAPQSDISELYARFASDNASSTVKAPKAQKHVGSIKWSFFIACLYAFFAAQLLSLPFVLIEQSATPLETRLWVNLFNGLEMARYIVILGLAAKFLGNIATSMTIAPRSTAIINGTCLGGIMVVGDLILSTPITPLSFCFVIGGAFGGYMFWRTRGSRLLQD